MSSSIDSVITICRARPCLMTLFTASWAMWNRWVARLSSPSSTGRWQAKLQETLKLSERLAATGRLAHIIAHEINNPLEAMSNLIYLSSQPATPEKDRQHYLEQAAAELTRISLITKQVLAYHRPSTKPVLTLANELLEGAVAMFRAQALLDGVELIAATRCSLQLSVHPGEIRQVFSTLILNAMEAVDSDGTISVRARKASHWKNQAIQGVRVAIFDNGVGIPSSNIRRIFGPFFTTKGEKGTGLGLWVASGIIDRFGGSILTRSSVHIGRHGTCFSIFLPANS